MKFMLPAVSALALQLVLSGTAAAQCVSVDPVAVPDITIDPLAASGPAEVVQPVALTFRRSGATGAPLRVQYQIVDEDSPIQVRVGMTAGPLIDWRSEDAADNIGTPRDNATPLLRSNVVTLAPAQSSTSRTVRLFLRDTHADLPAGVYREQYTVRYWCEDPTSTAANEAPGVLAVTIKIPNVLSARIGGASSRGEIDFMDFATLSRSVDVWVQSTGRYTVAAASLHDGRMVRDQSGTGDAADRISYQVRFGGQPIAMDGQPTTPSDRAGLGGQHIALDVSVEDIAGKRAGRYSDTITLTLAPAT